MLLTSILFSLVASWAVLVEPAVVADSCKVDEYTNVFCEDQQARLDNYALLLEKSSRARGFILVYGGKKDRFGQNPRRREAELRADAIKDYLVNTRGINSARLRTIDGGYRQTWTVELYVCSPETAKPKPTPTLSSNEIRFRTRKVKREEYVVFCG